MHYLITHTTTYLYDRPIALLPHVVRLRPRCDVTQTLKQFSVEVRPKPVQLSENIDLDGNGTLKLWFKEESTSSLIVSVRSEIETYRTNPFAYLLEPWAVRLPLDYPVSLLTQLQPYLVGQASYPSGNLDPVAVQLAQDITDNNQGNVVSFLSELNQHISQSCSHMIRETGDPFPPGLTWSKKAGSCRDLTVLFMEVCRAAGLASRFVSGYQEGDPDWKHRHLHAWAEVYLPGAGWRGYDPTQGVAVGDRHIALVASPSSRYTAPISGSIKGGAQSTMDYKLTIVPNQ